MARIFDWSAKPAERRVTVASLRAKAGIRVCQVTAETEVEAAAAAAAGIEMVVCRAANVRLVRQGGPDLFVTAALGFAEAVTDDEIQRTAFRALTDGADAVITARRLAVVSLLAAEDIPVVGQLGFVPRKSIWVGKVRAVGKTESEALELWNRFRRLEEAGAFAVEAELIPARLMAEINRRTGLVTVSLGSGSDADVVFCFSADICGEADNLPRHARAYGDVRALQQRILSERTAALSAFRQDVTTGKFPSSNEVAKIDDAVLHGFVKSLTSFK